VAAAEKYWTMAIDDRVRENKYFENEKREREVSLEEWCFFGGMGHYVLVASSMDSTLLQVAVEWVNVSS
jgi:hypothetical protein